MATPTYVPYDVAKPNIAQTRQAEVDAARTNALALRDAFISMLGNYPGWSYGMYAPDPTQPTAPYPTDGVNLFWVVYGYGAIAGEPGFVSQIVFTFSADGLASQVIMPDLANKYVARPTYDANGYISAITWSVS